MERSKVMDGQGSPERRARLYAWGFDFDDSDEERPYIKAGQRYHYNDAIVQVKLERMWFMPAYDPHRQEAI
jgi:hypothetical protein